MAQGSSRIILFCGTFFLMSHGLCSREFRLPLLLAIPAISLWLQALFMTWNARGIFDPGFWQMVSIPQPLPGLPGSIDLASSREMWIRFSALLVSCFSVVQIVQYSKTRSLLLYYLSFSTFLLIALGLAQKLTGASDIFWGDRPVNHYFFSTFRYHANAGAFFNLCSPLMVAVFCLYPPFRWHEKKKWLMVFQTVVVFTGILSLLLHGSRAASAISLCGIGTVVIMYRKPILHTFTGHPKLKWTAFALSGITAITICLTVGSRWAGFFGRLNSTEIRLSAYRTALEMIPDVGLWGIGPGCFKWVFPFYGGGIDEHTSGFWRHLHQDYLQTLLEWGLVGSILWFTLLLFSAIRLAKLLMQATAKKTRAFRLILGSIAFGLVATALHALGDFPMQIFSIQLTVFIYLGIIWGTHFQQKTSQEYPTEV